MTNTSIKIFTVVDEDVNGDVFVEDDVGKFSDRIEGHQIDFQNFEGSVAQTFLATFGESRHEFGRSSAAWNCTNKCFKHPKKGGGGIFLKSCDHGRFRTMVCISTFESETDKTKQNLVLFRFITSRGERNLMTG
jgi:hypothetical protein